MNLPEKFLGHVRREQLFTKADHLVIACSGGVDSRVLAELCRLGGFSFSIAHCNFKLREQESDNDELFVKNLAQALQVPFHGRQFDTSEYAKENKLSIQEAARALRYNWFEELIAESKNQKPALLLTAHHADDNAETITMHFFRGTGLHGLTGIPEKSGYIRRPLLSFTKEELVSFANEQQLEFVEDSSNASSKYTRNFFRNEILPAIQKVYPEVIQNLQNNITRFRNIESLYKTTTAQLLQKMIKQKGEEMHIPFRQLLSYQNKALVYEWISPFGFSGDQVEEIIKLADSKSAGYVNSPAGTHRIIKHRNWFILAPVARENLDHYIISEAGEYSFAEGKLSLLENETVKPGQDNKTACLDARNLAFPFILRKWKAGDYFYPLGMPKKKKLSRFFIDQKFSKTDKEKAWVIECKGRIIWIVGHRIDDRFKILPSTKYVLTFEWKK